MSSLDDVFASCVKRGHSDLLVHPPTGLFIRHKGDLGNILEQRSYWKDLSGFRYGEDDLLLDVGGYIGDSVYHFFTAFKLRRAISVEPDEDNARVFAANWGQEPKVTLIRGAVTPTGGEQVKLYKGKNYPSTHSLTEFRGRDVETVETVGWDDLLARRPTVIKFSAEGAEHDLDWSILPDSVREVGIFLAQKKPGWIEKSVIIDHSLLNSGFKHVRPPPIEPFYGPGKVAIWSRR